MRQSHDDVACFEDIAAVAIRRQPPRSHVVDTISGDEGIVIDLSNFVTERGNVREIRTKDPARNVAGIVQDPAQFVLGVAGIENIGVKADHATFEVVCPTKEKRYASGNRKDDMLFVVMSMPALMASTMI